MKAALLVICLATAGCTTTRTISVPVNVPIPVKCKAEEPTRPAMPTENVSPDLPDDKLVFEYSKAAAAEILLREAYEVRLLAELKSCL